MKNCPACADEMQNNAKFCRHCGNDVSGRKPPQSLLWLISIGVVAFILTVNGLLSSPRPQTDQNHLAALQTAPTSEPANEEISSDQKSKRLSSCKYSIDMAWRIGFIRDQPSAGRIDVDEVQWAELSWRNKMIMLDCLAVIQAGGGKPTHQIVSAYGWRTGKELAGGSPGDGTLAPD